MTIPQFLRQDLLATVKDVVPSRLGVQVRAQRTAVLCWASVAAAIFTFYKDGTPEPCSFATTHLGKGADCCGAQAPPKCSAPFKVDVALGAHAAGKLGKAANITRIKRELIELRRPIACVINLSSGTAHAVVLDGCEDCVIKKKPDLSLHFVDPNGGLSSIRLLSKVTLADIYEPWFWDATVFTKG